MLPEFLNRMLPSEFLSGISPTSLVACTVIITFLLYRIYVIWFYQGPRGCLVGKRVLITGGASGLGRRMALYFAEEGCSLVLWDLSIEALEKVQKEVVAIMDARSEKRGGLKSASCVVNVVNVTDRQTVYATAESIKKGGKIDILVNNAGIVQGKRFMDPTLSDDACQRVVDVNTTSHFWTIRAFLGDMFMDGENGNGHIVTIASSAGICGLAGLVDYNASKFGAFGTGEALRLELHASKKFGIGTTLVCPYYINTGMFEGCRTRFPILLPILEESYVAYEVVRAVKTKRELLVLPWFCTVTWLCRFIFPVSVLDSLGDFLGLSSSMDAFKGRGGAKQLGLPEPVRRPRTASASPHRSPSRKSNSKSKHL